MHDQNVIIHTETFAKDILAGEGSGHDWWHVQRVRNMAATIHGAEGGDWFIIEMALLLHDVGDRKVIHKDDDDYSIAHGFLTNQGVAEDSISKIMSIIMTMSYSKSFDGAANDTSIEFMIVQDADRLDAIGAIGIARAFAYGGSVSRLLYDPDYQSKTFGSSDEYKKSNGSTFHHFEEKLLLIKNLLNTQTAKLIAQERDVYMRTFLNQFMDEWNGKK